MKLPLPTSLARGLRLASLCPLLGLAPFATAASADTFGEPLRLPDIAVSSTKELPPPEAWQYTRLEDGTEVLANSSERATRRLLRDFQIFQQALEVVWPLPQTAAPARSLILCGARAKFDDFTAPGHNDGDIGSTSLFLRNREQVAILVDLQSTTITLSGLFDDSGAPTTNFEVDPYKQLYREYVRYLLSQGGRTPAWLQEGIAQLVMAMEFTPEWITIGKIDSSGYQAGAAAPLATESGDETEDAAHAETSVGDRPFNVALKRRALIPLDRFFAVATDSPEAQNPLGNNRWAKQAYAFVHLCLYGEGGRYQKSFAQFIQRLGSEPHSEKLFQECFHTDYRGMLTTLRGYIEFTAHTYKTYKLKPGGRPLGGPPVTLRDATQAEIGRIKGDAQRLAALPDRALATYRLAYARGERDPALLAALGSAELAAGHSDRASPILETAAKSRLPLPSHFVALARTRLAAAQAKPAGPHARLDDTQLASVLDPLFQARQLRPPLPETYDTIAEAWLAAATPPKADHLAVLVEGLRLFPRHNPQFHRLAELYARAGDQATATSLAQAGLRLAPDDAAKARYQQLLASLSPAPK
jgi:tetratricopeptide (TPR) repeat protein